MKITRRMAVKVLAASAVAPSLPVECASVALPLSKFDAAMAVIESRHGAAVVVACRRLASLPKLNANERSHKKLIAFILNRLGALVPDGSGMTLSTSLTDGATAMVAVLDERVRLGTTRDWRKYGTQAEA